jgi:UDP-N-acetylmuramoyl-tripeptide--D-alanyl-D-alanine ligase
MRFWDKDSSFRGAVRRWRESYLFQVKMAIATRKRRSMKSMRVIAITGSSTKSTTTAILRHILSQHHRVVGNDFDNGLNTIVRILKNAPRNSEFAVLEVAAGKTPQIERGARIMRPDVAIVTMIGLEHFSAYRTKEAIAHEKGHLVEALSASGIALLNADDEHAMAMAGRTAARIVSFGLQANADYRAQDITFDLRDGLRMRVSGHGHDVEIGANLFGRHFYLPVLAAVACALELGISPEVVQRAVASFSGIIDRCGVFPVSGGPVFVIDTCKAPLHSITLPMDALGEIDAPRKTIVIGQISDYGGDPKKAYSVAARHAASVADRVFMVGPKAGKARFDAANSSCEFARFEDLSDLARHLKETAMAGEAILLKSSGNLHLERAALALQTDVNCWAEECGVDSNCFSCGLYTVPFHEHPQAKGARKRLARQLGAKSAARSALESPIEGRPLNETGMRK